MTFKKVENHTDFIKDCSTGAILNTNLNKVDDYKARKVAFAAARQTKQEINTVMERLKEVDELKKDIAEIKEMLKGLVK